jgi:hypothetical protein
VKTEWEDSWPVPRLEGDSAADEDAQRTSDKEGTEMSEDEGRVADHMEQEDEVEAHRRATSMGMTDESTDEARKEDDDDFEAHRKSAV